MSCEFGLKGTRNDVAQIECPADGRSLKRLHSNYTCSTSRLRGISQETEFEANLYKPDSSSVFYTLYIPLHPYLKTQTTVALAEQAAPQVRPAILSAANEQAVELLLTKVLWDKLRGCSHTMRYRYVMNCHDMFLL